MPDKLPGDALLYAGVTMKDVDPPPRCFRCGVRLSADERGNLCRDCDDMEIEDDE